MKTGFAVLAAFLMIALAPVTYAKPKHPPAGIDMKLTAKLVESGSPPTAHSVALSWTQSVVPAGSTCPSGTGSTAVTVNSVYRGTTAGGEGATPLFVSTAPIVAYTDLAVTAGTTYFYKVTATNCAGESGFSTETPGLTIPNPLAPNAPTGLTGVSQ